MNAPARIRTSADLSKWRNLAEALFDQLRARTADGRGVTRECYADGEKAALNLFRETAEAHDLACRFDRASNLVIAFPDDDGTRPAIILGSHADSVPQGGNFDGAAGVVAGLLCLIRLQYERLPENIPVRVLVLRGEESAFYGRANIGSRALFGLLQTTDLNARRLGQGHTLRDALQGENADIEAIANCRVLMPRESVKAYLELHIEQGPVLVARDLSTAIVTGIRGNLRHRHVVCRGEAGHSGTVPRELRRDAMLAVSDLLMRLDEHWKRLLSRNLDLVFTAGVCGTDSEKQAISRIPGEVYFSFEVRSQNYETLEGFYELFCSECRAVSDQRSVSFEFDERVYSEPAKMDETVTGRLAQFSEQLGYPVELIPSGAGHDAAVFANAGIPSGMIFVRNRNGSHNPDESMTIDDFIRGVELMYAFASARNGE